MKIQLEIGDKDLSVLIDALRIASESDKTPSFKDARLVLDDIKDKIAIGLAVFNELAKQLGPFTDGSTIMLESDIRNHLGISKVFIESDCGLIAILNYVLKLLLSINKPGAKPILIEKEKIDAAKTIQDLVNLILDNYEKSK